MDTQRFAGCSWSILPWSRCWSCWVSLRFLVSDCCGVWAVFCCGILFYRISLAQLRLLNCAVVVGNPEPKNLLLIMPWWLWSGLACLRKSLFLNHCSVVSHGDPPQKKAAGLQDSDQSKVKLDARVTDKDPRFENFFFGFFSKWKKSFILPWCKLAYACLRPGRLRRSLWSLARRSLSRLSHLLVEKIPMRLAIWILNLLNLLMLMMRRMPRCWKSLLKIFKKLWRGCFAAHVQMKWCLLIEFLVPKWLVGHCLVLDFVFSCQRLRVELWYPIGTMSEFTH